VVYPRRRRLIRRRLLRRARFPQRLVAVVGASSEDEEHVGEAVEVSEDLGVDVLDIEGATLCAAANGPADV